VNVGAKESKIISKNYSEYEDVIYAFMLWSFICCIEPI
jgi:hypothetical protein